MFCAAFMCLELGFLIFWQKEISVKAVCKMLVKLTTEHRPHATSKLHLLRQGERGVPLPQRPREGRYHHF